MGWTRISRGGRPSPSSRSSQLCARAHHQSPLPPAHAASLHGTPKLKWQPVVATSARRATPQRRCCLPAVVPAPTCSAGSRRESAVLPQQVRGQSSSVLLWKPLAGTLAGVQQETGDSTSREMVAVERRSQQRLTAGRWPRCAPHRLAGCGWRRAAGAGRARGPRAPVRHCATKEVINPCLA